MNINEVSTENLILNDPRSPSVKYSTPINVKMDENHQTLVESSISNSSFLINHALDDHLQNSSLDRYTISTKPLHLTLNLPRHIIKREKIDKVRKLIFSEFE